MSDEAALSSLQSQLKMVHQLMPVTEYDTWSLRTYEILQIHHLIVQEMLRLPRINSGVALPSLYTISFAHLVELIVSEAACAV